MKRNIFGKHILLEIQPLADYLYVPCRIQMRRRSLQRQIQMDSTQIHKQEWMFSDRNALRKVWPLANSSTLYTSPPQHTNTFLAYKYIFLHIRSGTQTSYWPYHEATENSNKNYIQSTSNDDDGDDGYDGDHYNWDTEDGDDGDDEEDVRCKFDHLAFTTIHTWSVKEFHLLMWSLGGSQQPFSFVLGHFRRGDEQTTRWS